ncbi:MAG: hypothetical protein VR64_07985 [Desulfatitalea sp. BRH_c12]|nr:MAG: hypothetical protein VR64_07985 [Desulfatitalea sp. BRH_c12]
MTVYGHANGSKKIVAALIGLLVFSMGLTWLLWLRFQAGDLYPPYSSLRGDPLGTQVLFESLDNMGVAERNFRPLNHVVVGAERTLVVCGLDSRDRFLENESWRGMLAQLSEKGGRLVLSFQPAGVEGRQDEKGAAGARGDAGPSAEEPNSACPDPAVKDDAPQDLSIPWRAGPEWTGVLAYLGLALQTAGAEDFDDFAVQPIPGPGSDLLPDAIPWRAPLSFDLTDPAWQVRYVWHDRPVVVSRSWGRGSVVMVADSYLFSNEALRGDRVPEFLSWVIQAPATVIFEEYHHGLVKQPGIAGLLRKYRLQGVAAVLLVVIVLLIWRQAAVLVPRSAQLDEHAREFLSGRESVDGWIGLMQRHIDPRKLLDTCHETWRNSPASARIPEARVAEVERLVAEGRTDPRRHASVAVYKRISELLKQGKQV